MKLFKKLFSSLSFLALTIGILMSIPSKEGQIANADSLCLGEATISEVRTMHPFDPENHNEFVWFIIKDADYPDVDGKIAPFSAEHRDAYKSEFLSKITILNQVGNAVQNIDIWDAYVNMWTYHTNLALGIINGYDAWTINIEKGMKIPSYAYISGATTEATYYTIKYDYTATRLTNTHAKEKFDTWSIENKDLYLGEATISEVKTMHPFDPENHNEFIWFIIKDADYPDIDGQNAQFSAAKLNEFKPGLLAGIELLDSNGAKVSGADIWEAYINMWTYHTNLALGFLNGYDAWTITVKAGTIIPSYAYIKGETSEPTYYKIACDYKATRVTNTHTQGEFDTWNLETLNLHLGEATISEVRSMHPFDPENHNEFIWFIIKDADYPDIDGQVAPFSAAQLNEFKAGLLAGIEILDVNGSPVSGADIWEAYINMWTYHTNLALGVLNGYEAWTITVKAGTKIPSYKYISGASKAPTYYTIKNDTTATRVTNTHTQGEFDTWVINNVKPTIEAVTPVLSLSYSYSENAGEYNSEFRLAVGLPSSVKAAFNKYELNYGFEIKEGTKDPVVISFSTRTTRFDIGNGVEYIVISLGHLLSSTNINRAFISFSFRPFVTFSGTTYYGKVKTSSVYDALIEYKNNVSTQSIVSPVVDIIDALAD